MSKSPSMLGAILALLASLIVYFAFRLYQNRRFYKDLPKPPHSLLWGHLAVLGEVAATIPPNSHPQLYYTAIARKYNLQGIFYLDLWPIAPSQVVLTDPELQDQVSIKKPLPNHPLVAEMLGPMVGENVIAGVNGPLWKSLHKAMVPAFSWSHLRSLTDVIVEESWQFRNTLDKLAATGEVFSMEETAMKLIFDVIARILFNFSLNAQTTGSQQLDDLREMVALAEQGVDITAKYNPWRQAKLYLRRRILLGRLRSSLGAKISERFDLLKREKIVPSRKDPYSILDLMLRDKLDSEDVGNEKRSSSVLTSTEMQILLDNIKGLLVGGHGTTTDALCYIYMLLSKSPDVVENLRSELDRTFDKDHNNTVELLLATPGQLQNLPYTEAVIKETLRLFPVGFGVRAAEPGSTLTYNNRPLPIDHNLAIALNGHDIHYNPKYFSDPMKYNPSRWLDSENAPSTSYFRTFGRGPRGCLGQNLALNELKIILVMTIRDYEFECADLKPNQEPKMSWTNLDTVYGDIIFQELGLEAKPRGGMMMRVRKRSHS